MKRSAVLLLAMAGCASSAARTKVELDLDRMLSVVESAAASGQLPENMKVQGIEPSVLLWSVLRDEAGGTVAEAAKKKLAESGRDRVLEPGCARVLLDRAGTVQLADGTRIDWSPGQPTSAPRAEVEVDFEGASGSIVAGQPVRLRVRVSNVGKGDLHQLLATTSSELAPLAGVVVLFGRVAAGQKMERVVELVTPSVFAGNAISIGLHFDEPNGYAPAGTASKVAVSGAPRPVLGVSVRAFDDGSGQSVGNGDGVVQRGEAVDLVIGVQNTGNAPAVGAELELKLPQDPGIQVFGAAHHALGTIAPRGNVEVRVSISVKPTFKGEVIPITAHLAERSEFAFATDVDLGMRLDQRAPRQVVKIDRAIFAVETAALLAAAADDARPIGKVEKGSKLRAVGELGGFVQVEYTDAGGLAKRAWLLQKLISYDAGVVPVISAGSAAIVRETVNAPPLVVFLTPSEGSVTETSEESVVVKATVKDDVGIADVTLSVNGAALANMAELTRGLQKKGASPGGKLINIDRKVSLAPGKNTIAISAKDTDGETQTIQVIVDRSVREAVVVALVVGVDQYEDSALPALRYAESDARAIADFLRGPRSPIKNPGDVKLVLGKDATAKNIRLELDRHLVGRAAHPEDMAIFYFAGHGFSDGDRYYLAGVDTSPASLRATAIRESELQDLWKDIRAERKVFIADACHAGGLKGMRGDNTITTGLLEATGAKQGKGRVTILASRGTQQSVELEDRAHGAFTWALLEGLAGRADTERGNKDGRVSVRELTSFLDAEVPALARTVGHEQNPMYEVTEAEGDVMITR